MGRIGVTIENARGILSCWALPWGFSFFLLRQYWCWVTHWDCEWQAGFINLSLPSTQEFGGHLSFQVNLTHTYTLRYTQQTQHLFHPVEHRSWRTILLHHAVQLLPTILSTTRVRWLLSSHHRGKWKRTGSWSQLVMNEWYYINVMFCYSKLDLVEYEIMIIIHPKRNDNRG